MPLNKAANRVAFTALQQRRADKFYLAVVRGHVAADRLIIPWSIGSDTRPEWQNLRMCSDRQKFCSADHRSAETRALVLSRGLYDGLPATKVLLKPVTGRRHQLRVHMHELGHTIVGDFTYSDRKDVRPNRMFLHAHRFTLPNNLERLDILAGDPFAEEEENLSAAKLDYAQNFSTSTAQSKLDEQNFSSSTAETKLDAQNISASTVRTKPDSHNFSSLTVQSKSDDTQNFSSSTAETKSDEKNFSSWTAETKSDEQNFSSWTAQTKSDEQNFSSSTAPTKSDEEKPPKASAVISYRKVEEIQPLVSATYELFNDVGVEWTTV